MVDKMDIDSIEVPWNNLELPMEVPPRDRVIPQNILVKQHSSKVNNYDRKTPIKKLIDKVTSDQQNVKHSIPSLAHLMGMDTLPPERKLVARVKECKYDNSRRHLTRQDPAESSVSHCRSSSRSPTRQAKKGLLVDNTQNSSILRNSRSMSKSPRREQPREEFQKFKNEGWQEYKLRDESRKQEHKYRLRGGENNQVLVQEYLRKGKTPRYIDSKRNSSQIKSNEFKGYASTAKLEPNKQKRGLGHEECSYKQWQYSLRKDDTTSRNIGTPNKFEHSPVAKRDKKEISYPIRIDFLEPSSERFDTEETHVGPSKLVEKGVSTDEFLEDIMERLRFETERKGLKSSTGRGSRVQTSLIDRSNDPKQLARDIANHIKESVSRDLGTVLTKSMSARLYSSKPQINEPDPPEVIRRRTRKFLSEKLENILRIETDAVEKPLIIYGRPGSSRLAKGTFRLNSKSKYNVDYSEDKNPLSESIPRPFRHEQENAMALDADAETVAPRGFTRSVSCPLSGTAFGELLLEDQCVLNRALICMDLEASEHTSTQMKNKKVGFNLKESVSNLRQNFTLKGKLFGNKIQLAEESSENKFDFTKATVTTHADILDLSTEQDNTSELPPSPTSVSCSSHEEFCRSAEPSPVSCSSHEEFCRSAEPSPVSILEVPFTEDQPSPQLSGEPSFNISELSLSELVKNAESEQVPFEGKASNDEVIEVEGDMETYLRDILVNSGLYVVASSDQGIPKWDAPTIPQCVYEKVEEDYSIKFKLDNGNSLMHHNDTNISHKMLFDLVNEAIPSVLVNPFTSSKLKSWIAGQTRVPHGRNLFDALLHQIKIYTHLRMDESDSEERKAARDAIMTPWLSMLHEDIDLVERKVAWVILGELIDEFVYDMLV